MNPFTAQIMSLFKGHMNAHGKYVYHGDKRIDGKVKGHGETKRDKVTTVLWDRHLDGKEQLGIIPIDEQNTCYFGAIDVDDYEVDREALNAKIWKKNLPLVITRSKSGGCHIWLFIRGGAPASLVQSKLKEFAALLGVGGSEIFPKQTELITERGDIGQWINMPYFKCNNTDRYCCRCEDDGKLNLKEFVAYANEKAIDESSLDAISFEVTKDLKDGPPCLQHLITQGFPDGTRNVGLFQLAIYAKKSKPQHWRKEVEKYNTKYMDPPLSAGEVITVCKSLEKESKNYNYQCKTEPICSHCNSSLCRTRKFGVGEGTGLPEFGSLTKITCDPPIWFLDITDGGRLELSTEDLQQPRRFQNKCMSCLNIMPVMPKSNIWQGIVMELFKNITIVEVPKEATPEGRLMQLLEEFCANRGNDEDCDVLLRGMVWNTNGNHHVRFSDFLEFLERKRFFAMNSGKIINLFKQEGFARKKINIRKGRQCQVFVIPRFEGIQEDYTPPRDDGIIPF